MSVNRTKIWFSGLLVFFIALTLVSSVFYEDIISFQKPIVKPLSAGYYTLENASKSLVFWNGSNLTTYITPGTENHQCKLSESEKKTVVLRIDDLGAWHYYDTVVRMTDDILDRNMSVSFAVIPYELEKDKPFLDWLTNLKDDPRIEIAQHGNQHLSHEFLNLTYEDAYAAVQEGKQSIIDNLHVEPVTFIPPENEYNDNLVKVLEDSDFKILSARDAQFEMIGNISNIGLDAETYNYYKNYFVPVDQVLTDCAKGLYNKNTCVIMIHPQDYVQDQDHHLVDEAKYTEYIRLLDELQARAAEDRWNIEFKTFRELVDCPPKEEELLLP